MFFGVMGYFLPRNSRLPKLEFTLKFAREF